MFVHELKKWKDIDPSGRIAYIELSGNTCEFGVELLDLKAGLRYTHRSDSLENAVLVALAEARKGD